MNDLSSKIILFEYFRNRVELWQPFYLGPYIHTEKSKRDFGFILIPAQNCPLLSSCLILKNIDIFFFSTYFISNKKLYSPFLSTPFSMERIPRKTKITNYSSSRVSNSIYDLDTPNYKLNTSPNEARFTF